MFFLGLLSLIILVVPVFVTFGVYFATQYQHILSCGFSCGTPGANIPGGGGFIPPGTDITQYNYCQLAYSVTPPPGNYLFNPNQWNNVGGNDGSLCLKFTSDDTPGDDYALPFQATWNYLLAGPATAPVHAFPNAQVSSDSLPVQLSSMSGLNVDIEWSYTTGNTAAALNEALMVQENVNANVCVDMFLAPSSSDSQSTTESAFEVMVWLGRFGYDTLPLGYDLGALDTMVVSGTTFTLYSMANAYGQLAFTWLADANTTSFKGDIGPLIRDLGQYSGPDSSSYLGYTAFGSETLHADMNATFSVSRLELDVQTS